MNMHRIHPLTRNPLLRKALLLAALLLVAPFAMELLIFLQFGGVEVAFLCLLATVKPWLTSTKLGIHRIRHTITLMVISLQVHRLSQPRFFFGHLAASVFILMSTGSTLLAGAIWWPILITG